MPPRQRLAWLELKIRQASQYGFEGDLTFKTRERCAETEMSRPSKRDVSIIFSLQIESVRIRKAIGIPIGRGHYGNPGLAFFDDLSAHVRILRRNAGGMLAGAFVAKQFLDTG